MARVASYIRLPNQLFLTILVCSSLVGCGYKGPLYLPPPPDTLSGEKTQPATPEIPPQSINPSLEPAPIVIE